MDSKMLNYGIYSNHTLTLIYLRVYAKIGKMFHLIPEKL